jgi:lanthanide-dependent methanol dehydrogenase
MESHHGSLRRWMARACPHWQPVALTVATIVVVYAVMSAQTPPPAAGAEWTTPAGTIEGTRFSSLKQITAANVRQLREEFRFTTGVRAGHEGAPLVVNNTMYVVSPFPNRLFALDLNRPGQTRWVFDPRADRFARDKACCDIVNRGAVFANGKVIYNVLDNTTVAVDAVTGREVWRRKNGDPATGQSMTMGPIVVRDKVFVGNSGGEMGVRGFIAALNVDTGAEVWRAWSTGPDTDVRIGSRFNPFYAKDRGKDLGVTTWPGAPGPTDPPRTPNPMWKNGGSTVWGWLTFDPKTNLLFYGTANPGPWNPDIRQGDNKWSTTIFARDPDTGDAIWAYQVTPHDAWDFDGVNESIAVDLTIGTADKLLVHFDRNGFAYTMDRATGQVLRAEKFVDHVNWADSIDLVTGKPNESVPSKRTKEGVNVKDICPAAPGGKDFQPAAFSPDTKLFYVPTNNLCMDYEALKVMYIQGAPFVGASVTMKPGLLDSHRGAFIAWDPVSATRKWEIRERFPVWSGALATAGGIVFYGTMDRWFRAVDAKTGAKLFEVQLPSGIIGEPMTFSGPDGKQRVAVYAGVGGWAGGVVPARLSTDDPFAGLGAVGAMADLGQFTPAGGSVHVFKLP